MTSKHFYETVYSKFGVGSYGGDANDHIWARRIKDQKEATTDWLKKLGVRFSKDEVVLELGCGLAYLAEIHPGYVGLEFSKAAVERVRKCSRPGIQIRQGNMLNIPFENESVTAVFSWAAIEHVDRPEVVFEEIMRVLKPGGGAILAPAWHCRSWTVKKLEIRPYSDLKILDRAEKALIPIRKSLAWRVACEMPGRLFREAALLLGRHADLSYRKLHPMWELNHRYSHIADDDALASINMHSALCYFESRGWTLLSSNSTLARIACRSGPVVVKKPI